LGNRLTRSNEVDAYCPSCVTCISENPEACTECGEERSGAQWKPIEFSPLTYLGYLLDDRYLLDRYLGGGASGEVYRAVDRKLDRPFALKVVEFGRDADSDVRDEEVRRYRNEVRALSRLRNPHVVNIYESFEIERHTSGLLTEYVDGFTLGEMMEAEGPLPFRRAVKIIRQVANGLHEAHEQGVVHRDLKPGNVMIEELPAAGYFARILDFGLVRLVDDASQTDGFRGTPLYAAPEQCRPEMDVDRRADVYGLGCVMFHALTGRPPFLGTDIIDVIESHTTDQPPSLIESSSDTEIPSRLDGLMDDMLRKEPESRPESLGGVIEVLDEVAVQRDSNPELFSEGFAQTTEVQPLGEQSTIGTVEETEVETASSSSDGTGTWSTQDGGLPAELLQSAGLESLLTDYTSGTTAVRLQKRGECIALTDGAHCLHLVARGTYDYEDSFRGARMRVTAVAGPRDRGGVFASEMNGRILRWGVDLRSSSPESVADAAARVLSMDVDAEETAVVLGTERGAVIRYDLRTGEASHQVDLPGPVCEVRVAPGGREGVAATMEGDVHRLVFNGEGDEASVQSDGREPGALAVDNRAQWAAVLDRSGELRVVHLRESDRSFTVAPVPENLRSLNFSANGQLMGVSLGDSVLRIWAFHHESVLARGVSEA